jgi:hypothetical protein
MLRLMIYQTSLEATKKMRDSAHLLDGFCKKAKYLKPRLDRNTTSKKKYQK